MKVYLVEYDTHLTMLPNWGKQRGPEVFATLEGAQAAIEKQFKPSPGGWYFDSDAHQWKAVIYGSTSAIFASVREIEVQE